MKVGFSWQTGTSAWGLMAYYEGILGIHPDYDGLVIRPCLPATWKNVEAYREFRGNRLRFRYKNRGGYKVRLKIDGNSVDGTKVPLFADNEEHTITVELY